MEEYISLEHMVEISEPKNLNCENYYIPHHSVYRENSSTTKLPVVFDASMKTLNGILLNEILLVGPVVQSDLISILI